MKKLIVALTGSLALSAAASTTVAIIDSGTDMKHRDIAPVAWTNPVDSTENLRDEDRNGYPDDIHGWNFAESNNKVIDYQYLGLLNDDVRKFFDLQLKSFLGTITQEEREWIQTMLENQEFLQRLQKYGNFMHGTHVGGIAIKGNEDAKLLAVKLIPTEVKLPFYLRPTAEMLQNEKGIGEFLLKRGLKLLAGQQMELLKEISEYVDGHDTRVANGSFGTGFPQAKMIVQLLWEQVLRGEPTEEELKDMTIFFLEQLIENGQDMVAIAPKTLFVFAAGNDGLSNDEMPASPASIRADNVITVGASQGRGKLARFSNFGEKKVDVAAPGVGILSAAPGDEEIRVSGTSQAAPFVANVATKIFAINPELAPVDVKKILMETVDIRDDYAGKIGSRGIVNKKRATRAAALSTTMDLESAISMAQNQVVNVVEEKSVVNQDPIADAMVMPLPSLFSF